MLRSYCTQGTSPEKEHVHRLMTNPRLPNDPSLVLKSKICTMMSGVPLLVLAMPNSKWVRW